MVEGWNGDFFICACTYTENRMTSQETCELAAGIWTDLTGKTPINAFECPHAPKGKTRHLVVPTAHSHVRILPLGAGQDVGRSCILVSFMGSDKLPWQKPVTIMLDCGIHLGYNDSRRYPNFKYVSREGHYTEDVDAVVISHFHLDHIGALPVFTENCGYQGPIFASYPTKAIAPIMLKDLRSTGHKKHAQYYTDDAITKCLQRVTPLQLRQTVVVNSGSDSIEITPYYAGHVLGAVMFRIAVNDASIVYTGDFNTLSERHLGAASIPRFVPQPDVLISESTYATSVHKSRIETEKDLVDAIRETVIDNEGKVLIPIYAVGRLQELLLVIEEYWKHHELKVPVYVAGKMSEKANTIYSQFVEWCSADTLESFELTGEPPFSSSIVKTFDKGLINAPNPMVVFATPGTMEGGISRKLLKAWSGNRSNLVVLPGHYVPGTVGAKLLETKSNEVELDPGERLTIRCRILRIPYSAHTDRDGIINTVTKLRPNNVVLVHGEKTGMTVLQHHLQHKLNVPTFSPPNHTELLLPLGQRLLVEVDNDAMLPQRCHQPSRKGMELTDSVQSNAEKSETLGINELLNMDIGSLRERVGKALNESDRLSRKRLISDEDTEVGGGTKGDKQSNTTRHSDHGDEISFGSHPLDVDSRLEFLHSGHVRLVRHLAK